MCPRHPSTNWQPYWSPRALTVVSARKLQKLALNSGTNGRSAKNDAKMRHPTPSHGELVEIMSRLKVRTARRDTATRSINCVHFSILGMESKRLGSEFTALRKCVKFAKNLSQNMYPLLNQAKHASRIRRTPEATPKHRRTERYEGKGKVQISRCE